MSKSPATPDSASSSSPSASPLTEQSSGDSQADRRVDQTILELHQLIGPEHHLPKLDFSAAREQARADQGQEARCTVVCDTCHAETALALREAVGRCAGCGKVVVATGGSHRAIKPQALVPFYITRSEATALLQNWLANRKAPKALRQAVESPDGLLGLFVPFWSFNGTAHVRYRPELASSPVGGSGSGRDASEGGKRGRRGKAAVPEIDAVETVLAAARLQQATRGATTGEGVTTVGDGGLADLPPSPADKPVVFAVQNVLIADSHTIDRDALKVLEPWRIDKLTDYDKRFVVDYQIDCYRDGLERAYLEFQEVLRHEAFAKLRALYPSGAAPTHFTVELHDVSLHTLLLPVWLFSRSHEGGVVQVLVNAQTGEIHGKLGAAGCAGASALLLVAAIGALAATGAGLHHLLA